MKKKKNNYYNDDREISFEELIESRKQEMAHSILPGFFTIVKDPKGRKKDVKVYSVPYMKRQMFSVNPEVEKEAK